MVWTGKKAQAKGIGGDAKVCGVVEIPVGIGHVNGLIEATVVEDEVPFLLSIQFLKQVGAIVDLQSSALVLTQYGKSSTIHHLHSGHVAVQVLDFHEEGWQLPDLAVERTRKEASFRVFTATISQNVTFMWEKGVFTTCAVDGPHRTTSPAGPVQEGRMGESVHERSWKGRASCPQLAGDHGARGRPHGPGSRSDQARRLASRWICAWLATVLFVFPAGVGIRAFLVHGRSHPIADHQSIHLCRADPTRGVSRQEEVQGSSDKPHQGMWASHGGIGGCRQSSPERGVVPQVSCTLGSGCSGDGRHCQQEEGDPRERQDVHNGSQVHDDPNGDSTKNPSADAISEEGKQVANDTGISIDSSMECRAAEHSEDNHYGMPLQSSSCAADCEKGGSDTRPPVLEVRQKGVQFLRVGSPRNSGSSAEAVAGAGGCGGAPLGGARGGREKADGPTDYADGRTPTPGDHGGGQCTTRLGGGDSQEPAAMDVCGGRRGTHGGGVQEPRPAARDDEQGNGNERGASKSGGPSSDGDGTGPGLPRESDKLPTVMTEQELQQALQEDAPQVILLKNEAQWNLWCKKQLEESSSEKYERQVADGFWVPEEDGTWRFHSGILPRFHTGVTAVGKFCDSYFQNQDYEPEEERPLSKATCKAVNKRMKQLVVSEFFSPPRVSKYAEEKGHLAGGSFDLETGYDLSMEVDRRRCWKELRQADPDVIVVSPPCGPFSILQSLNQRHQGTRSELRLAEGREHLQFAMEVFRWQTLRGKLAIFEHPATSRAWQEECVQEIMMIPGVQRVRADQCQYGLAVKGGAPNRKPTDFLTNGVHTAIALSRRCRGEHAHQPLIGGIAHLAQRYPRGLCAAMINGSKKDLLQRQIYAWATSQEETEVKQAEDDIEELLRQHEEKEDERQQAEKERGVQVKRQLEAEDSHERREGEDPDHVQGAITAEDKRIINKLHQNLGHPNNYELSKALRLARARNAVWRYVKDEFKCDICERNKKPKAARPAMLPKTFEPCRTIGLDVVYFPALDVRQVRPVLNMLDWATGYQMLEPLDNTQSSHIWEKFHSTWIRTFSVPEIVVTDQGREFGKELAEKVSQAGALHRVIGARAPWQQGRTERRGGVAKEVFVKLRESMLPTSEAEWKMCVHAVEAAKNRMYNRSGFSPAQRQFGYNMRLPGSLGSDDVYSPELLIHSSTDDMQRAMEIRNHAMQEYLKHVTSRAVAKAQWARGRVTQEFKIGDVIYVYRVPLQRKRARSEVDFEDREGRRATWVGPGVVIMVEGANAWLSIRGELWKCALEQLRHATPEEQEARDLLHGDFEDLRVEMTRKASKRGFEDITQWERDEPPRHRPRLETAGEPEEEEGQPSMEYAPSSPPATEREPSEEPEMIQQAVESTRRCEQLDGTMRQRQPQDLYGPTRRHVKDRWRPYQGGASLGHAEEVEAEDEEHQEEDLWIYDVHRNSVIRKHNQEREESTSRQVKLEDARSRSNT